MPMTDARCLKAAERIRELDLDGLLVTTAPNRRFLSGFSGSAGSLLISGRRRELFTDGRYTVQASQQARGYGIHIASTNPAMRAIEFARDHDLARIGFDDADVSVSLFRRLEGVQGVELVAAGGLVEALRLTKDQGELALMRRAIKIADEVMALAEESIKPGVTERSVAAKINGAFLDAGADGPGFDTIVAAGRNSARPHHAPSDYEIAPGDPVVVDMGALVDGYHSDITRTFCAGGRTPGFMVVYDSVLAANRAGIGAAVAGASCAGVDATVRSVIDSTGFGGYFDHGLGHGVGLEIHEGPRLAPGSEAVLEPGMVHSIEPGIYLPDWGGIRIEDLVLVNAEHPQTLSQYPR
jgi:Xaa-Pro aminopeptidase